MFNPFKRRKEEVWAHTEPASPPPTSRRLAAPRRAPVLVPEAALPEVVAEGNTQADWSAWEDSMVSWDSQMQDLMPSSRVYVRETSPSQLDEIDAFASVGRKRDL